LTKPEELIKKSEFSDKMSDYIVGKEIGKGAYAVVRQAIYRPTGTKIAIKIYEKYKLLDPAKKGAVRREIGVLKMLDHQHLVKLHEVIDSPKQV
jgi:serine/threonine protein kinase